MAVGAEFVVEAYWLDFGMLSRCGALHFVEVEDTGIGSSVVQLRTTGEENEDKRGEDTNLPAFLSLELLSRAPGYSKEGLKDSSINPESYYDYSTSRLHSCLNIDYQPKIDILKSPPFLVST